MRLLLIGIIIAACGTAGVSYVQLGISDHAKTVVILAPDETVELESTFDTPGMGFFRITLEEPRAMARVAILSPVGENLGDKTISTKQSVDYFAIERDGTYTLRVTLISAHPSQTSVELGHTGSAETMYPAIVLVIGIIIIMVSLCVSLARYITAQPDENNL